ncbi:MAG: FecCD family ABC transporter permease [Candidatus Baldrarchaeia archaeon]
MQKSIISRKIRRLLVICTIGMPILSILFLLSLAIGPVDTSIPETINSLISVLNRGGKAKTLSEVIIYHIRLPRTLCVLAVGVGLSLSGAVMQAIVRNPLVDPYITGVSSGAALGACLAVFTGVTIMGTILYTIPLAAFLGALLAFLLTMSLAEAAGGSDVSYVLAGVVVNTAFSSLMTILIILGEEKLHGILFWLFGSFAYVSWRIVWIIIVPVFALSAVILLYAYELNVVLLGDEQALQLGLAVKQFKKMMIVITSLLTSICVSFNGIIGFLGIIVPHTARMLVGSDHRILLPSTIILGAIILIIADMIARILLKPIELPIGAITSLIGVPFFAYLLAKRGRMYAAGQ